MNTSTKRRAFAALVLGCLAPALGQTRLSVKVRPTVFVVSEKGEARQILTATVSRSPAGGSVEVVVTDGNREWRAPVEPSAVCDVTVRLRVPRTARSRNLTVYLARGSERLTPAETFQQRPVRDWKIFFQTTPHIDLGYTDLAGNVEAKLRSMTLDDVFRQLRSTGSLPPGERLHWTSESSWFFDISLEKPAAATRAELAGALERGQLSIGAFDFNLHSEMCTLEELIRGLFRSRRLAAAYPGLDATVAMQSDPPGYAWGLCQALVSSGVRYLAIWANNAHPLGANLPEVFYWEAPDGGRVLTVYQPGYAGTRFGNYRIIDRETGKDLPMEEERLLEEIGENANHRLLDMEESDYPLDALLGRVVGRDNGLPPEHIAGLARAWNARYLSPRIASSGPGEFFRHVEKNYANRIPVLRGDLNSWWIDGAATLGRDTGLARQARERATVAEMLQSAVAALGRALPDYPQRPIADLFYELLRYDEHTFGLRAYGVRARVLAGGDSTTASEWERWRQSWRDKGAWARRADEDSRALLTGGLRGLAAQVAAPTRAVLVFNSAADARDDIARIPWPEGAVPVVTDPQTGKALPGQMVGGEFWFLAAGLPPVGYKTYPIAPRKLAAGRAAPPAPLLENRHYRFTRDETRAGIRSIIDKETGEELIDARAPFAFDQLLYQEYSGIASQDRHRDTAGTAKPVQGATRVDGPTAPAAVERGDLFDVLRWNAALTAASGAMPRIEQTVRVYHPIKRVELVNRIIGKRPTATTEGVYLAFPFRVPGGSWRIENAGVVWQAFADLLPGANPNVFSVGRWVSSENARHFVALAPLEAPLVEFGEIRSLRLDDVGSYRPRQEHVYAQLLNNFWGTNFPLWQGGDFTFSWAVTSGKAGEGTTRAAQLGQSVLSPPAATIVEPHRASRLGFAVSGRRCASRGAGAQAQRGWSGTGGAVQGNRRADRYPRAQARPPPVRLGAARGCARASRGARRAGRRRSQV